MLEALTEFISSMLEKKNKTQCILAAHDWGAVIGYRLVSEGMPFSEKYRPRFLTKKIVGFLFKHAILLNAMHVSKCRTMN